MMMYCECVRTYTHWRHVTLLPVWSEPRRQFQTAATKSFLARINDFCPVYVSFTSTRTWSSARRQNKSVLRRGKLHRNLFPLFMLEIPFHDAYVSCVVVATPTTTNSFPLFQWNGIDGVWMDWWRLCQADMNVRIETSNHPTSQLGLCQLQVPSIKVISYRSFTRV